MLACGALAACTAQIKDAPSAEGTAAAAGQVPGSAGSSVGGSAGGSTNPPGVDDLAAACEAKAGVLDTGRTPLRRLTRFELDNSVRALLGVEADAASTVTPDEKMGPFYSNAIAPVDELGVQQYQELAGRVATAAAARMAEIAGCDLAAGTDCPARFVSSFGLKAYRRPLEAAEQSALLAVFEAGKAAGDAALGFRTVVEAMLQSPFFLYHDDTYVGVGSAAQHPSATPLPLSSYALAARLSFFFLGSTPDAELLTLAGEGKLSDAAQLAAQARRLFATPAAEESVGRFHSQWLAVGDLANVDRNAARFPAFGPALVAAAAAETKAFSNYVLRQGGGKLSTLLSSNLGFPSGPLFDIYGVAQPAGYVPGTPVTLDPAQRAGLLTQSAFLMRHAHPDQTSPVHRGIVVRENLLCGHISPPPPSFNVTVPPVNEATTTRERFAEHVANPVCGACHKDIDPLGLGFENYDAVGAYRTRDGLGDVDASGAFTNVRPDLQGTFVGAVQMAQALAKSEDVADCVSRQWFRFALGRVESADDACTTVKLQTELTASGGDIPQLLEGITASEAFRFVRSTGGTQ